METKDILKQIRKNKGYSARDVAEGCEMSLGVYQKYESGERGVGTPALMKLADFYGVTTDYLLGRNTEIDIDIVELVAKAADFTELEKDFFGLYISLKREERTELISKIIKQVKAAIEDAASEHKSE